MIDYLLRAQALESLEEVRRTIREDGLGAVPEEHGSYHWGGGGVIISTHASRLRPDPWRSQITYVRTPHAATIGWLFYHIRDVFPREITCVCKEMLYVSMAESMVGYQAFLAGAPEDQLMLALAALDGAERHIRILTSEGIGNEPHDMEVDRDA